MKLDFLPLHKLSVGKTNMRRGRKAPDVADILPTVRARGVIQPILVRPDPVPSGFEGGAPASYEIVAGRRRFHAASLVAEERRAAGEPEAEPLDSMMPCAILDDGDDAAAIEASMIENMARLDADEVSQWESFTRLMREGRKVEDIAATFGLPELAVRRVLALGNLMPRIRQIYARQEIDAATVRHLTLASKRQQRAWLALADDPDAYLPTGYQLKAWLFGGQSIPASHALFDVEASGLATIADLFGEDRYFTDADAFWEAQNAAIDAKRAAYLDQGWAEAVVVPPSDHFSSWEFEKAGKRKGGRVYLDVRASGEVIAHEGYLSRREAARLATTAPEGGAAKPQRPELTGTMQTYIDLHRHAAVRAGLLAHPGVALRLMVAHAITGSHLWRVSPEPQLTRSDEVRESVETCAGETAFDERRRAVLDLLRFSPEEPTVTGGNGDDFGVAGLFHRLLGMPDAAVMAVVSIVIGETLASGSAAVEAVGLHIGIDMARYWQADDAFFRLIRDKQLLTSIIAEIAGEAVAAANAGEKTKTMKRIIRDCLDGTGGRAKVEAWVPRWMAFPPSAYTDRGGVGTVAAHLKAVAATPPDDEPDPGAPQAAAAGEPESESEPLPLAA